MPVEAHEEVPGRIAIRLTGALTKPDFEAFLETASGLMASHGPLDVFCHADGFEGWSGPGWDDPALSEFAWSHDKDVRRIAIVGEPKWEDHLVAFAGGYYTSRDVKFFPDDQFDVARDWLQRTD